MGDKKSNAKGVSPHLFHLFIAFVKAMFGAVKIVLAILGVLVLAVVASLLLSIPGGKRFSRYCSYPDMKALMDAERNPWGQALRKLHFKWENC